jgi:hypothetical protein
MQLHKFKHNKLFMKILVTLLIIIASYLVISTIYSYLLCTFVDEIFKEGHSFDDGSFYYYGHEFFIFTFALMLGIPTILGWMTFKKLKTEKTSETRLIIVCIVVILITVYISLPYIVCGWGWTNFALSYWSSFN